MDRDALVRRIERLEAAVLSLQEALLAEEPNRPAEPAQEVPVQDMPVASYEQMYGDVPRYDPPTIPDPPRRRRGVARWLLRETS